MYGLAMVLFTAGVQKIPQSLYDAARVDGAGPVREFFAVTLPGLRGEIAVALTLTTIAALRNFDLVYITTQGGPGDATSVPGLPGLRPRVPERPGRLGRRRSASCLALRHLRARVRDQPRRRAGRAMIARREQTLTYAILGVFSLIALVPIVGILAHRAAGRRAAWPRFGTSDGLHFAQLRRRVDEGHFASYLRSSAIVVGRGRRASRRCFSILAGYAFGLMRFRGAQVLFYVFLLGLMVPTGGDRSCRSTTTCATSA